MKQSNNIQKSKSFIRISLLTLCIAVAFISVCATANAESNLISYHNFTATDSPLTDETGNGHTAMNNGSVATTSGSNGLPLRQFNSGTTYATIPGSEAYNNSEITIEAMVRLNTTGWNTIASTLDTNNGFYFGSQGSGTIYFINRVGGTPTAYSTTAKITDGQWHLVQVSYNATKIVFKVDTLTVSTQNTGASLGKTTSNIYIGAPAGLFPITGGEIHYVKIYNTSIVNNHYYNETWRIKRSLGSKILDLDFRNDTESVIVDSSAYGHNGENTGTTLTQYANRAGRTFTNNTTVNLYSTPDLNAEIICIETTVRLNASYPFYHTFVQKRSYGKDGYWDGANATGYFYVYFICNGVTISQSSTIFIADNITRHLTAQYNGSVIEFYVNGSLRESYPVSGGKIGVGNTNLTLNEPGSYHSLQGEMYNVRIYNEMRTPAQIAADSQELLNGVPPVANFTANLTSGTAPLIVGFSASLSTNATAYYWNTGDGSTYTTENVTHTFTIPGVYTVYLTASNAYGNDTLLYVDMITVTQGAIAVDTPFDLNNTAMATLFGVLIVVIFCILLTIVGVYAISAFNNARTAQDISNVIATVIVSVTVLITSTGLAAIFWRIFFGA